MSKKTGKRKSKRTKKATQMYSMQPLSMDGETLRRDIDIHITDNKNSPVQQQQQHR